jgi:predicted metal-dependent hydrolase
MEKVKAILEATKMDFEMHDNFKIRIKRLKTKAASISFGTRVIRLNRELANDPEFVTYLIYHELAHYKLQTRFHGHEFYKLLNSKLGEEKVRYIEKKIHRKMLEANRINRPFD